MISFWSIYHFMRAGVGAGFGGDDGGLPLLLFCELLHRVSSP